MQTENPGPEAALKQAPVDPSQAEEAGVGQDLGFL
jgi:hypothetical protein